MIVFVPRISRVFLILAVAGLWIEHHARLRVAGYSFLAFYRRALGGFVALVSCSSCEKAARGAEKTGPFDGLQLRPSRAYRAYERRELRMRW